MWLKTGSSTDMAFQMMAVLSVLLPPSSALHLPYSHTPQLLATSLLSLLTWYSYGLEKEYCTTY